MISTPAQAPNQMTRPRSTSIQASGNLLILPRAFRPIFVQEILGDAGGPEC
jgi:hypothetical protein